MHDKDPMMNAIRITAQALILTMMCTSYCIAQHCLPEIGSSVDQDHDIDYFQWGDFVNADETFHEGYVDYYDSLAIGLSLFEPQEIVISMDIEPFSFIAGNTVGFAIWIDFDNDYEFEEDEKVWNSETSAYTFTDLVETTFLQAFIGERRMRVKSAWGLVPDNPCINSTGETEDYKVYIQEFEGANGSSVTYGNAFIDSNQDCIWQEELGIEGQLIEIQPLGLFTQTDNNGFWHVSDLDPGDYTVTLYLSENWASNCLQTQAFTVAEGGGVGMGPSYGIFSTQPCPAPSISIDMPFMRPCFSDQRIYIEACNTNQGTGSLEDAYAIIQLDPLLTPTNSSMPYLEIENNQYVFDLGTIIPGQCIDIWIDNTLSCEAPLGRALCMQAELYPHPDCVFDDDPAPFPPTIKACNTPWDFSSLTVDGFCENDTAYFEITNESAPNLGDMDCFHPVRVYQNGILIVIDSVQLAGQEWAIFAYEGQGHSWHLQVDQHPFHPGNSTPNATVESCGGWTANSMINDFPLDDADPVIDIFCGITTGSYDPNDKTGYPIGVSYERLVPPNQSMEYKIRFQNTGTDTAFTVIVRDTLDEDFDIFSVVPGVSSHDYEFAITGPRVLQWTFNNILLPDSGANEILSNGFLKFKVDQIADLPNHTQLSNSADIYFDFNDPITTNETRHTVDDRMRIALAIEEEIENDFQFSVYPNPNDGAFTVHLNEFAEECELQIVNTMGQVILTKKYYNQSSIEFAEDLHSGMYFIRILDKSGKEGSLQMLRN